jgi:hypothetical protein
VDDVTMKLWRPTRGVLAMVRSEANTCLGDELHRHFFNT